MNELNVRIIRLEHCRVASAYGYGSGPEGIAWSKLIAYIKASGLDKDGAPHRFLGFNNPSPTPGSPNYGYEQWITVSDEAKAGDEIKIKEFGGGLYAVTRCQLRNIFETWQELAAWREKSRYGHGSHQWLEEAIHPDLESTVGEEMELDLLLPITE